MRTVPISSAAIRAAEQHWLKSSKSIARDVQKGGIRMSEEIFGAVQKLPVNGTKKQVVLQCAPLLIGIKLSNLLNVRADQKEEVFKLFEGSKICCRVLYEFRGRLSILLYRPGMLRAYLEREDVKRLMASFGYEDLGLEETLDRIAGRLSGAHGRKTGIPP